MPRTPAGLLTGTCTACPSGSFNNGYGRGIDDTASCRTCGSRETKTAGASDGYQECTCTPPFSATAVGEPCLCPAGYYLSTNSTCAKCAAGFYSAVPESTTCISCNGPGQAINAAQTSCSCQQFWVVVNATACGEWFLHLWAALVLTQVLNHRTIC